MCVRLRHFTLDNAFQVSGRGQLHLTVLIETMRREGFELMVGPPTVITKKVDGVTHEPFETVEVQVCPALSGAARICLNMCIDLTNVNGEQSVLPAALAYTIPYLYIEYNVDHEPMRRLDWIGSPETKT